VVQHSQDLGRLDNTLIIYINGDNAPAPRAAVGTPNEVAFFNGLNEIPADVQLKWYDVWGTEAPTTTCRPAGRGPRHAVRLVQAERVQARRVNQNMVVSWPARIKDKGGLREQFVHVIDVVRPSSRRPAIKAPEMVDGIKQAPIEGTSFLYTFDAKNAKAPSRHRTQYSRCLASTRSITTAGC